MQRTKKAPIAKKKRIAVSSAKAKGRNLQKIICKKISELTGYEWGKDCAIESRPMGQCGVDVRMESAVKELFPFATECKYQETWSISQWVKQAQDGMKLNPDTEWVLFIRKNKMKPESLTVIDTDTFFRMLSLIPACDRKKIIPLPKFK
jgi:hypothetical protein